VQRIIAVAETGEILGVGISGGERLDVPLAVPSVKSEETGWRIYARAPNTVKQLSIYAYMKAINQACLITARENIP
jgi:hypothetical protein